MPRYQFVIAMCISLILSACGGSGGGGSGGGNSSTSNGNSSDQFTISASTLTFKADKSDGYVASQSVIGTVVGVDKAVYVLVQATDSGIAFAGFSPVSNTSGAVNISVKPPGQLTAGTYTDTVTINVCFDENCNTRVKGSPKTVTVTYTVTDNFKVIAPTFEYSTVAGGSDDLEHKVIQIGGSSSQWTVKANQSWIKVSQSSGNGAATVDVSIDKTSLPSGSYTGEIVVVDATSNTSSKLPVNMVLSKPAISISATSPLIFKGAVASDFAPLSFSIQLNTGTNAYPWTINHVKTANWLIPTQSSGLIANQANNIQVLATPADLDGLSYSGVIQVDVLVNGETISALLPATLNIDPHYLTLRKHGVAFTSINGLSTLTEKIQVDTNRDISANWSTSIRYADTQSPTHWLTATQNGKTGEKIVVTADPSGLVSGKIYYATIQVNSDTSTIVNSGSELIRVGFYVDSQVGSAVKTVNISSDKAAGMVSDPIRPFVYVSSGNSLIQVFNVYTGLQEKTYSNLGSDLRQMTLSDDGNTLFVIDQFQAKIQKINLDTDQILTPIQPTGWDKCSNCANAYAFLGIKYVYSAGKPVLVSGAPQIIDPNSGEVLAGQTNSVSTNLMFDVAGNGKAIYTADMSGAPFTMWRYTVAYDFQGQAFSINQSGGGGGTAYARGFWSDYEGTKVYRSCWYPNEIEVFSGVTGNLISYVSSGTNGGAVLTQQNTLLCMRYYSSFSDETPDVWELDPLTGNILNEYNVSGEINERQLLVSGDGKRIITRSQDQSVLTFLTH